MTSEPDLIYALCDMTAREFVAYHSTHLAREECTT